MAQLYANGARSVLVSSITASSAALQIDPAHEGLFPVAAGADWFKVAVEDSSGNIEYIRVQRATGQPVLTVTTRAVEDSVKFPARTFSAGSVVQLRMTAADLSASVAHPNETTGAHQSSAISLAPSTRNISTNVQAALNVVASDDGAKAVGYGASNVGESLDKLFAINILECRVVFTDAEYGAIGDGTGNQATAINAAIAAAEAIAATKGGCDVLGSPGRFRTTSGLRVKRGGVNLILRGGAEIVPVGNFDTITFEHDTAATFIYKNHLVNYVADETGKTGGRSLVGRYLAESNFEISAAAGFDGVLIESFNTVDLSARLTGLRSTSAIHALIRGGVGGAGGMARSDVLRIGKLVMGGTYVAGQHGLVLDGFVHTVVGQSVYPVNIGGRGVWVKNSVSAEDVPTFLNFFDLQADYCMQAIRMDAGVGAEFHSTIVHGSRQGDNIYTGSATKDVKFLGGRSTGASQCGIALAGADSVVTGMTTHSNSSNQYTGTKGAYPGIIVGGTSRGTRVFACRSGNVDADDFQSYGIQVDFGAEVFNVSINDVTNNINSGINNGAGTSSTKVVSGNIG